MANGLVGPSVYTTHSHALRVMQECEGAARLSTGRTPVQFCVDISAGSVDMSIKCQHFLLLSIRYFAKQSQASAIN